MKNKKVAFLSAALVILGGTGLILGNGVLASNALEADNQTEPAIVIPEGASPDTMQLSNVGMYSNTDGESYMTLTNSNTDVQKEESHATDETDLSGRCTSVVAGSEQDPTKRGTPLENELSSDKAQEIAIAAIIEEYALTQKTLDKFTVTTIYFEVHPNAPNRHVWRVNLDPTNVDEFTQIGCYMLYIDAETGEVLQMQSAANGVG